MHAIYRTLILLFLCSLATQSVGKTYLGKPIAVDSIKPRALAAGDTIMIVAPMGELSSEYAALAKSRLETMGFKVLIPENMPTPEGHLARSDQQRAAEIMAAFNNPDVDAIFPGTSENDSSTDDTMRILDLLDYAKIRANPKVFIGSSNMTCLHMALDKKCDFVTFYSPGPPWGLGSKLNRLSFAEKYFWRNLLSAQNRTPYDKRAPGFFYHPPTYAPLGFYSHGKAEGILCGGNLSMIASLTGTEYQLETNGRVLFLEDTNQTPRRISRMLRQMQLTGQLDSPAAVVLGQFGKCSPQGESKQTLDEVFLSYFAEAKYPVVNNFPAGQSAMHATLPLGALVSVSADESQVRILENPVLIQ